MPPRNATLFSFFLRNETEEVNAFAVGLACSNHLCHTNAIFLISPIERKFFEAGQP